MLKKTGRRLSDKMNENVDEIFTLFKEKTDVYWKKIEEDHSLSVFHAAAQRVPAYKDFLKKNKINHTKIKSYSDFQGVPTTSKASYLRNYPLEKLLWNGSLKNSFVFSATSGSTGKPFYFPRTHRLDWESSIIHEMFLRNDAKKDAGPVLIVVCFGMGVWIGGMITYKAFEITSHRGHPVSIITPGINKTEIFNALRDLAPNYKSVVLVGYPPFMKDILDEAGSNGVDLKKLNLRLLFAAEAFTEQFRDYVSEKAGIKNVYRDTLNIYGSSDIGSMAYETPLSIMIRRLASKDKKLFNGIFSSIQRLPTLTQYNPMFIGFDAVDGNILLTGSNAIPLIRYEVGDHGGVMSYSEIKEKLAQQDIDINDEIEREQIGPFASQLPFVYVYERSDFSTTLYGLQIYPGTIRDALVRPTVNKYLTGKFTLITKFSARNDQYLEINLELHKNKKITSSAKDLILKSIVSDLLRNNSEYKELHRHVGKRAIPKLVFWPAEHPKYFKAGAKQKWVNRI